MHGSHKGYKIKSMNRRVPGIIAVGNIFMDSVYRVSLLEMERRGFSPGSFTHLTREELDDRLTGLSPSEERLGGSSFNKAMVVARFGIPVRVVGIIDRKRRLIERAARESGAMPESIEDATVARRNLLALGAHLITPEGEWAVAMAPGAFSDFDAIDDSEIFRGIGSVAPIVTVEVYLVNHFPWLERVVAGAERVGSTVHFDLGAPPLVRQKRHDLIRLIAGGISLLSGTEGELEALLGEKLPEEEIFRSLELQRLVVKRGARGVTVIDHSRRFDAPGSGADVHPPLSVGCGDVLDGALLTATVEGNEPFSLPIVEAAARLAGNCCRYPLARIDSKAAMEFDRDSGIH